MLCVSCEQVPQINVQYVYAVYKDDCAYVRKKTGDETAYYK